MKNKKLILGGVALAAVIAVFALVYHTFAPKPVEGAKTVTLTVVHSSGKTKVVEMHTDAEYLGEALLEQEGLVEGEDGPYGLYIKTVDGETVSGTQWWCLTKAGGLVNTGADLTPIADGEQYTLTCSPY